MGGCGLPPRFRVVCQGHERVLCRDRAALARCVDEIASSGTARQQAGGARILLLRRCARRGFDRQGRHADRRDRLLGAVRVHGPRPERQRLHDAQRRAGQAAGNLHPLHLLFALFPLQRIGLYDAARRQLLCAARAADAQRGVYRRTSGSRVEKRDAGAARYGADALSAFVAGLFVVGRQQRRGLRRAVRTRRQPSRDSSHQGDGPRLQSAGIRGRDG